MKYNKKTCFFVVTKEKIALITGITGQDGSYLAELLINKGYSVHGIIRRSSSDNTSRIKHLLNKDITQSTINLHYGDLSDSVSITNVINTIQPDEKHWPVQYFIKFIQNLF